MGHPRIGIYPNPRISDECITKFTFSGPPYLDEDDKKCWIQILRDQGNLPEQWGHMLPIRNDRGSDSDSDYGGDHPLIAYRNPPGVEDDEDEDVSRNAVVSTGLQLMAESSESEHSDSDEEHSESEDDEEGRYRQSERDLLAIEDTPAPRYTEDAWEDDAPTPHFPDTPPEHFSSRHESNRRTREQASPKKDFGGEDSSTGDTPPEKLPRKNSPMDLAPQENPAYNEPTYY